MKQDDESIEALKGNASQDLMDVVFELGSKLFVQAGISNSFATALSIQKDLISSGKALNKFEEMIQQQGGHLSKANEINLPQFEKTIFAFFLRLISNNLIKYINFIGF